MLKQLSHNARLFAIRKQIAGGRLRCPRCGGNSPQIPAEPDQLLRCEGCGQTASHAEWRESDGDHGGTETPPDLPATQPAASAIQRLGAPPGDCEWRIPASGKSGGLLAFGIIWCLITAFASGTFLFAFLAGGTTFTGEQPIWTVLPIALFALFWTIGIGMLYAGFRAKNASHLLVIGLSRITLRRSLFSRQTERSILRDGTELARLLVFYQQNYKPVHGIEIRSGSGKLRFGSALQPEEKTWLVDDLNTVLKPASGLEPPAPTSPPSRFSLPIPRSGTRSTPAAITALSIGLVFISVGVLLLPDAIRPLARSTGGTGVFRLFDAFFTLITGSFALIWTGMAAIITSAGIVMLVRQIRGRHRETRLEGDELEIAIRTFGHGRVLNQECFPRPGVTAIRAFLNGSNNGSVMKRIELHADGRARTLVSWADGEEVDEFVRLVRAALGHS